MKGERPYLVVGGGVQGLAFALALAQRGRPVILAERSPDLGGQARSFRYGGFVFDFGLHAFVTDDARVTAFVRGVLGPDFHSFYPRAASCLRPGAIVADRSAWQQGQGVRSLFELFPDHAKAGWNCMLVSRPRKMIYPRRGGFGALAERMAELLERLGGRVLKGAALDPARFAIRGRRLEAVSLDGRTTPIRGCYWAAGPAALRARPASQAPTRLLSLFHFLVRGRPASPHHWVRFTDGQHPLLPRLVYFPSHFSQSNAPLGHHGVGAAIPLGLPSDASKKVRALFDWLRQRPGDFMPIVRGLLAQRGLIREADVADVRYETVPAPPTTVVHPPGHPLERLENFWLSDRWEALNPSESGAALHIAAALRVADDVG